VENLYDIAIIGSGPAAISAAINGKIRNKNLIIFGQENLSDKLAVAPKIDNYLGLYKITGKDLTNKFREHSELMGIEITKERVNNIYAMGSHFILMVNDKSYNAKTIIIATGVQYGNVIKGEQEYLGKGVGYCATCDAPLYKGKVVTIIGYNKEAEEEANFVSELVSKLYYIPMYKEEPHINSSIEIIKDIPMEIIGDGIKTNGVKLKNGEIKSDGIFVMKDSIPPDQLVPGLLVEDHHIKADRLMQTNLDGCFAAGDCVGKPYQYLKAAGEGQIAALSAVSYLNSIK
jgi:thioredoxin reductase (NADPH)